MSESDEKKRDRHYVDPDIKITSDGAYILSDEYKDEFNSEEESKQEKSEQAKETGTKETKETGTKAHEEVQDSQEDENGSGIKQATDGTFVISQNKK